MNERAARRRRLIAKLCAAVAFAGAGAAVLFYIDPMSATFFPKCFFKTLTGWHCPGCGTGRAAHALLHADFACAFRMNPLLIVALPFLAALALKPSIGRRPAVPWIILLIVIAYWILRNVPYHPFNLLAPH